jgi:equilibrative nucleoside transporter 1/2/3
LGYLHIYQLQRCSYRSLLEFAEPPPTALLEMNDRQLLQPKNTLHLITDQPSSTTPLTDSDSKQGDSLRSSEAPATEDERGLVAIYKRLQGPTWCIFLTFMVTLAMFPGWTSQLQSKWRCRSSSRLSNDLYTPLTFVLYNAGDLTGRLLTGQVSPSVADRISRNLVIAALLRVLLAISLFACPGSSQILGFDIPSDVFSVSIQFLFAATNGFLVTLSFAHAPTLLPDSSPSAHQAMSEILSFALSFGLLVGSFCSYPVSKVAHG